jgi:hypothetical protein
MVRNLQEDKKTVFSAAEFDYFCALQIFADLQQTVVIAQLVRAPDCGSGGRGFEPH